MLRHALASLLAAGLLAGCAATAWIGADGLVQRVDSVMPHPVSGDTQVSTLYSGWRDWGGEKFPARITQSMGGHPVLDLNVTEVQANPAFASDVPALVAQFASAWSRPARPTGCGTCPAARTTACWWSSPTT